MQTVLTGIILFVHDVEKLTRFYVDHLNLRLITSNPAEWALLKAGTSELGLHKIGAEYEQATATSGKMENNTKIVFELEEDIFTVHKELVAKSVAMREVKTWDDYPYWICDGEDPEGNIFQLRMKK